MLESSFATTDFDHMNEKGSRAHTLLRFEFFEVLVRIARIMYIDTHSNKEGALKDNESYRALHRLVNEHILPILLLKSLPEWQPFRDKTLWTFKVNAIFDAN